MLEPPFLELAFYVGPKAADKAFEHLAKEHHVAFGTKRKVVIEGLVGILDGEELELKNGTLLVRTSGEVFCGPPSTKTRSLRSRYGHLAYKAFVGFAEKLECCYGAILVEDSLEEPDSLRRDSTSLAFQDFYVGKQWAGAAMARIMGVVGSATFLEDLSRGTYFSMCADFNPEKRGVSGVEAQNKSIEIAAILATIATRPTA